MTPFHQIGHLAGDGARYVLDGLGIVRIGQTLEALILGGVEVPGEFAGYGQELVLNHAILVVVVDTFYHGPGLSLVELLVGDADDCVGEGILFLERLGRWRG